MPPTNESSTHRRGAENTEFSVYLSVRAVFARLGVSVVKILLCLFRICTLKEFSYNETLMILQCKTNKRQGNCQALDLRGL
jgi:hypothetical protein